MPTPLARKIKALIRTNGPISVTDYFALCLADPEYGYYRTRDPFGRAGDFTTAPEVSQLFGEMLGIFLVHAWQKHGGPDDQNRHAGDMGNVKTDAQGKAKVDATIKGVSLSGEHGVVGKSVIVHAKADDLKSQPSGDAGGRVAGGVIEMKK